MTCRRRKPCFNIGTFYPGIFFQIFRYQNLGVRFSLLQGKFFFSETSNGDLNQNRLIRVPADLNSDILDGSGIDMFRYGGRH